LKFSHTLKFSHLLMPWNTLTRLKLSYASHTPKALSHTLSPCLTWYQCISKFKLEFFLKLQPMFGSTHVWCLTSCFPQCQWYKQLYEHLYCILCLHMISKGFSTFCFF
jgi:hypothetical protein